jgi:hypothetical protein
MFESRLWKHCIILLRPKNGRYLPAESLHVPICANDVSKTSLTQGGGGGKHTDR